MEYGVHIFTRGATANPQGLATVASGCEAMGFDYFGLNDHVVITASIDSAYPYSKDGSWAGASDADCLDVLTTLAFVAAVTKRIRLLTSVMVVPHRPALLTAKLLTTVDVLSGGRLTVGAGVGWMREEIEALGGVDFDRRGTVTGEYIEAWRRLWRDKVASFAGEHVAFENVVAEPRPVQQPGPPIWIGGEGVAARRRAAALGDGWYPVAANPREPLNTPQRFGAGVADVRARAEAAGRDPHALRIGVFAPWARVGEPLMADGERMVFTGSRDAVVDDLGRYAEHGLQAMVLAPAGADAEQVLERSAAFADAVGIQAKP